VDRERAGVHVGDRIDQAVLDPLRTERCKSFTHTLVGEGDVEHGQRALHLGPPGPPPPAAHEP
jgi:hypothetical protein